MTIQRFKQIMGCTLVLAIACAPVADSPSDLTVAERAAITAAANASSSVAQSVSTLQKGVNASTPAAKSTTAAQSTEQCPALELGLVIQGGLALELTLDYGDGCSPDDADSQFCSGSATGTFSQQSQEIGLSFDDLTCNDQTLAGDANLTWSFENNVVTLDGDWDVSVTADGDTLSYAGQGNAEYSRPLEAATINSFDGTLSNTLYTFNGIMGNIFVSFLDNPALLPSSGEATVSGTVIRTVTVRFNVDTPETHEVDVSVDGSPFFTVNLDNL